MQIKINDLNLKRIEILSKFLGLNLETIVNRILDKELDYYSEMIKREDLNFLTNFLEGSNLQNI